ncbi:MAG: 4,5-DOPA dioxygenase extradiol [Syntrophobacteraceae bacterium]
MPQVASRMPVVFLGHGNPMNAISQNSYTHGWRQIGKSIPRPRAVLVISAHWYIPMTAVTAMDSPRTIYDFGGFPRALYEVRYPAPGDPGLAVRVQELIKPLGVKLDQDWGLDHGAWSVLTHVFPQADVPIVQLSIDRTKPAIFHYEIGKRLAPLRDEQVLIIGSGNLVHNLHTYAWGRQGAEPFEWATRFEERVRKLLVSGDYGPLIDYESLGRDAILSVPTPDHYLPLMYAIALRGEGEDLSFPVEGIEGGSVSMLSVRIG